MLKGHFAEGSGLMKKVTRCPHCPRKFETVQEMLDHVRKRHRGKVTVEFRK